MEIFISQIKYFLKKYRTFFWNKKTHPIILKGEKYRVDIDTKKDFLFLQKILLINQIYK